MGAAPPPRKELPVGGVENKVVEKDNEIIYKFPTRRANRTGIVFPCGHLTDKPKGFHTSID
jgi:hypothetical protein